MTRVVVNENASLGYEAKRDASKFMSMDLATAQIYSFDPEGRHMAINERPYAEGSVRLGLYLPLAGEYAISAERMDRVCWLYDAERDITHSFSYGPYTFAASGEGLCNDRFILGFAPADHSGVEGLLGAEESGVSVKGSLGAVLVSAPAGSDVALYGVDGTCVAKLESAGETISIPAEAGMYVVVAGGESFTVIVK